MISHGFVNKCDLVDYFQGIETDHSALIMSITDIKHERGPGYWKLNVLNLQNQSFCEQVRTEIMQTMNSTTEMQPTDRWEKIKKRVVEQMKLLSRKSASEKSLIIAQLSEKMCEYEESFPLNKAEHKLYNETNEELKALLYERTAGLIFRSKAKWAAEGEKNTKYFFNLEKARSNAKTCQAILKEDGTLVEDIEKILHEQANFYRDLYKKDDTVCFNQKNDSGPILSTEQAKDLDESIKISEIATAISRLSNNKSPGPDGLPAEFYKTFSTELCPILLDLYNDALNKREMNKTAMEGILNLIPKKNKDTRILKNLRPITLLNADYKIIEKVIAKRIQRVLPSIIHHDQTGFMAKRRMAVNVRRILDTMNYCEREELPAFILSIDFMKAFDRCEVQSILGSLRYFGFPNLILDWIDVLYSEFKVRIQNYGHFSEYIDIERSVHQGGCASAFLFNILVEVMAIQIRKNLTHSIYIKGRKQDLGQYADDTAIFSIFHQDAMEQIIQQLDDFHKQSGLIVNYEKTSVYRIGSMKNSNARLYTTKPLAWESRGLNILGTTITHHSSLLSDNYDEIQQKMQTIFKSWSHRNLTLIGKILVINSLIMSLYTHQLYVLPNIPQKMQKKIEDDIQRFIWNGRKAKIPLRFLQNPKSEGGLGLINLGRKEESLKISWIQILKNDINYANLAYDLFSPNLQEDIFRCNFNLPDLNDVIPVTTPPFWRNVLEAWIKINYHAEKSPVDQLLWYNSKIRIENKPFYWKKAHIQGLREVQQLFPDGQFITAIDAQDKYGLSVMQWNSLKTAIPGHWYQVFKDRPTRQPDYVYDKLVEDADIAKKTYDMLSEKLDISSVLQQKWDSEIWIPQDLLQKQLKSMYIVTNSSKLRSFYYRSINKALVLNSHLFRWKIRDNNLCTFCKQEKETNVHLFFDCVCTQNLWEEVVSWSLCNLNSELELSRTGVMINYFNDNPYSVANVIGLITKQYIYRQKCLSGNLLFNEVKQLIMQTRNVEKFNAKCNNQMSKFNSKWANFI